MSSSPSAVRSLSPSRAFAAREPRTASGALALAPLLVAYLVAAVVAQPGAEAVRDEPALLAAAERLLDGWLAPPGTDPDQRAFLWHGPGLVALLAPFVALDVPLPLVRLGGALLLGTAVLLFHRLLRLRLAPGPALAWTWAFGLYLPFFAVLSTVQKEPLATLLVVAGMLALTRGLKTGQRRALAAAGLALAALAMVRLEYGWVAVALLALAAARWAVRRGPRQRRLVAAAAVAVIACVPWLAYTHSVTGQPVYWGASSGLSLFWMSPTLPGETGQWHSPVRVFRDPALAPYRPLFRRLDEVHPLESDLVLRRRALANIRARPALYARNVAANASRLLFWAPVRSRHSVAGRVVLVVCNGLLLAGGAWAAVVLWRRRRVLPAEAGPLAAFAVLAIGVHLPVAASPRMLLPVVPALVLLMAYARAAASCPQAASMSRPRVSRTVAGTPCSVSTARKASIASRPEPS
jgi:4-amino-4-deoxy-L-arabinose transferase-like glycosyltransferase